MIVIGVTGGVGAGKSQVLSYLKEHFSCRILLADHVANELQEPGHTCYDEIVKLLGNGVLSENGCIDRQKMAASIFAEKELLRKVNDIVHPAVEAYIFDQIALERTRGEIDYFFVEAALLIECGYGEKFNQMWYIFAEEKIRARRLGEARGYDKEKIENIMKRQLSDADFRANCQVVIDNSGDLEETYRQIDAVLFQET